MYREPALTFAVISQIFNSHFTADIMSGISCFAERHNVNLVFLTSTENAAQEEKNLIYAQRLYCNGILLFLTDKDNYNETLKQLNSAQPPCLLIDRRLYGHKLKCVSSDHYSIGYLAGQYLSETCDRVIIFTLNSMVQPVYDRMCGFKAAARNRSASIEIVTADVSVYDFETLFLRLLPKQTANTGIFINSHNLVSLVEYMRAQDILGHGNRIVCVDEDAPYRGYCESYGIACIVQDGFTIGYKAVESLYAHVTCGTPLEHITVPVKPFP